jgi:hypothetical protein
MKMKFIRTMPLYLLASVAALMGCGDTQESIDERDTGEDVGTASQSVLTVCPFPQPAAPILFDNEMVIRSRSIVDDPCRTSWTGSGCPSFSAAPAPANRSARWSFGWLMTVMAGQTDPTSTAARQFVASWLNLFQTPQTIGTDVVAPRTQIGAKLIDPWVMASGCASGTPIVGPGACLLDLKKAPFRLLAIVNRIDQSGFSYGQPNVPGELRFVFGALNTAQGALNSGVLQSTVILEYKFPSTKSNQQWATQLHGLSSLSLGSSPLASPATFGFANSLQAITDLVTLPNAQSGKPNNGSVIGQVRTNEIDYDGTPSKQWEMRQFTLPCSSGTCQLAQVAVSQTPPSSANTMPPINDFLVDNQTALASSSHVVPASLLGGSSLSPPGSQTVVWEDPNPVVSPLPGISPADVRHHFGFSTCNGCHYAETANNTRFHIGPRQATGTAPLSSFVGLLGGLSSSDGKNPDYSMSVDDPDTSTMRVFSYNEPWRRACEIRRILSNSGEPFSSATGHTLP